MSRKRPYRLGKRQASVDETKRRIIDAATLEFAANGIPDTSMQAVARRAEVAPGTVLYHYPTPDDLVEAAVERWIVEMEAPSPEAIDPDAPLQDRVRALVLELFGLYERSEYAYRIYSKSPGHPVLKRYEKWWYDNVNQMMTRALGDLATEPEAMKVVSVLVNPGFRGTLLSTGVTPERSVDISTHLVLSWLNR
jgi:AcrR family transcriptional regulator